MLTKSVFKSKLNLVGVLTLLAGLAVYADFIPPKYTSLLLAVAGFATAILRTFYTNTVTTLNGVPTTTPAPPGEAKQG